ncbi:MAG: NAD-dependent deacetylase [bacterium]
MAETRQLEKYLSDAHKILIFTGAGISTGSGIPDYRGPSGVWMTKQPVYYQDFMASETARIEYWDYKLEGWETFRNAKPNAVHEAIVDLENADKILVVVTQNVDGLHTLAGTSHEKLVELHGTNGAVECQTCHKFSDPEAHFTLFKETGRAPTCEECGGYLKPATISFGQNLRESDLNRSVAAARQCDLVMALGSSLTVNPAASLTLLAAENGAPYIIINRGMTEHDDSPLLSLRLEGDVAEIFPPAVSAVLRRSKA